MPFIENVVVYSNFSFRIQSYVDLVVKHDKINFDFSWHFINSYADKMFIENAKIVASLPDDIKKRIVFSIMYEHNNISKSIVMHKIINSMGLMTELLLVGKRRHDDFMYEYSSADYEKYINVLKKDALKNIYVKYDDGLCDMLTDA